MGPTNAVRWCVGMPFGYAHGQVEGSKHRVGIYSVLAVPKYWGRLAL